MNSEHLVNNRSVDKDVMEKHRLHRESIKHNFFAYKDMNWLENSSTFSIDAVAQANGVADGVRFKTAALPELKISPCPTISRSKLHQGLPLHQQHLRQRADDRNDVLYSTTCHGSRPHVIATVSTPSSFRQESQFMADKEAEFQRHVKMGMAQRYSLPTLPTEFAPNFVTSWVAHGSDRRGLNNLIYATDDCK
ncbi:unnamed protein product [Lymnaea stagnalis]|uniref:Uncharacterized protein n=1 Tax=Lymnaea stagnalis TaxID=6523 RepID=A0AAV2IBW0_LYMST